MNLRLSTCPDCGSPVALVNLSTATGVCVALDADPVHSDTAAHTVAYVLGRDALAVPLGDVVRPPTECYVQHRCPQRIDRDPYAEQTRIGNAIGWWQDQIAAHVSPMGTEVVPERPRRLA